MRITTRSRSGLVVAAAGVLLCGSRPLHADLTLIDMFRNISYDQTSVAAPTTPVGFFLNLEANMASSTDFDSASVSYPGPGSPASLPLVNPLEFGIGPSFATFAAMNVAYPMGTYLFTANNSVTMATEMASLDYTVDAFTSDVPALTAATYTTLQGMNPGVPFTFNFNSFTPNINATPGASETFFTIFGTSFSRGGSPPTTSFTLPAGTLAPNTTYTAELDFSDRITGTDPINGVPTLIGYDLCTDVTFTTAVPEPSAMIPLAITFCGAGV
jgi:hypothetical protein